MRVYVIRNTLTDEWCVTVVRSLAGAIALVGWEGMQTDLICCFAYRGARTAPFVVACGKTEAARPEVAYHQNEVVHDQEA